MDTLNGHKPDAAETIPQIVFLKNLDKDGMPNMQFAGAQIKFSSVAEHAFAIFLASAYRDNRSHLSIEDAFLVFDKEMADVIADGSFAALCAELENLKESINNKFVRKNIPFLIVQHEDEDGQIGYALTYAVHENTANGADLDAASTKKISKRAFVQYESPEYVYSPFTNEEIQVLTTVVKMFMGRGELPMGELYQRLRAPLLAHIFANKEKEKRSVTNTDLREALQGLFKSAYNKAGYARMHKILSKDDPQYQFIMETVPHCIRYIQNHERKRRETPKPDAFYTEEWAIHKMCDLLSKSNKVG